MVVLVPSIIQEAVELAARYQVKSQIHDYRIAIEWPWSETDEKNIALFWMQLLRRSINKTTFYSIQFRYRPKDKIVSKPLPFQFLRNLFRCKTHTLTSIPQVQSEGHVMKPIFNGLHHNDFCEICLQGNADIKRLQSQVEGSPEVEIIHNPNFFHFNKSLRIPYHLITAIQVQIYAV